MGISGESQSVSRKLHHVRCAVLLARAYVFGGEGRGKERRMEHMLVRVVKAGTDECVSVVDKLGARLFAQLSCLFARHDALDEAVFHEDGQGHALIDMGLARKDMIGR